MFGVRTCFAPSHPIALGRRSSHRRKSTFGLCAWQGKLYIGGDFDYVGTNQLPASGLVARTSCVCPADFNNDGTLDFFDYLDFVSAFSAQSPSADFNGDNVIDFFDYLDFVQALGAGC